MIHRREVELPQPVTFYEDNYDFEVKVDNNACGSFTLKDGTKFSLSASALLAPVLSALPTTHTASLVELTEASLRFYRSGGINTFALSDYLSILFFTRYEWGLEFAKSAVGSIEQVPDSKAVYHFEARRRHSEMFAYGLAVHFAASLLHIPVDRLFFISASGSRPDFRARVSFAELTAAGASIGGLTASGAIVELEVKALQGWASFRSDGEQGKLLLKNLADKASSKPNNAHLSIGVALPRHSPTTKTKTKILIADPGNAMYLNQKQQATLLLEESLVLLLRHGLWSTLAKALAWLKDLRELTQHEAELLARIEKYLEMDQCRIVEETHGNRTFNGRIFSDVLGRLGQTGQRGMSREEAEERLRTDNLGSVWFSGVDDSWSKIIAEQNIDELLSYGVRERGGRDLSGKSAFYYNEEPMDEEYRKAVRSELSMAMKPQRW